MRAACSAKIPRTARTVLGEFEIRLRTSLSAVFLLQRVIPFTFEQRIRRVGGGAGRIATPPALAHGRLGAAAFRRRALIGFPPALERRRIASPMAQDKAS